MWFTPTSGMFPRIGDRLGGGDPDQQRSGQPRPLGHGHPAEIGEA